MIDYKIDLKKCEYLPDESLPILVLAIKSKYHFNDKRKFLSIAHQTAGHGCHQHYMLGTILEPNQETLDVMHKINQGWLNSDCGAFEPPTLDEVNKYREQLKKLLGADCNFSYPDFEEGIYPIDCTTEVIKKLCSDKLPKNLDDLIECQSNFDKFTIKNWHLYILGENCD